MTTVHTTYGNGHGCDPVPFQNYITNALDFPTGGRPSKALVSIKAKFALHGHAVHDDNNRDFTVVQKNWGLSRYSRDYAELVSFGRQFGVL